MTFLLPLGDRGNVFGSLVGLQIQACVKLEEGNWGAPHVPYSELMDVSPPGGRGTIVWGLLMKV